MRSHAECVSGAPLAPMTFRGGPYQEDLSDELDVELLDDELSEDFEDSDDFLSDLSDLSELDESEFDEDDDAAFSRRRLAVP